MHGRDNRREERDDGRMVERAPPHASMAQGAGGYCFIGSYTLCVYTYIYIHTCIHIYIYIYIYPPAPWASGRARQPSYPSTIPLFHSSTISAMYSFYPLYPVLSIFDLRFLSSIVPFSSSLGHLGSSVDARGKGWKSTFPTGGEDFAPLVRQAPWPAALLALLAVQDRPGRIELRAPRANQETLVV